VTNPLNSFPLDSSTLQRETQIDDRRAVDVDALPVSDRMKQLIRGIGEHEYSSRSEAMFAVVRAMVTAHCSNDQIRDVMFDKGLPIGAHVRDQPNPIKYLERQIKRICETAGLTGDVKIKARVEDIIKCAADLQTKTFEPLKLIVPKYLPEGISVLDGRPKIGKSWLALDTAVAVASGGICLGEKCEEGDVLALMLEDSDRRLQRRLTTMLGAQLGAWPARLTYATSWPRLNEGGLNWIREWISKAPKARLVIVDILERVRQRDASREKQSLYSADYGALVALQELASEAMLSIVVCHHQRKLGADDLIDTLSGTLGLGGAVDSVLILGNERNQNSKFFGGEDATLRNSASLSNRTKNADGKCLAQGWKSRQARNARKSSPC
jgi:hypothetical protein